MGGHRLPLHDKGSVSSSCSVPLYVIGIAISREMCAFSASDVGSIVVTTTATLTMSSTGCSQYDTAAHSHGFLGQAIYAPLAQIARFRVYGLEAARRFTPQ